MEENSALKSAVKDLKQQHTASISSLTEEIKQLKKALSSKASSPPTQQPAPAPPTRNLMPASYAAATASGLPKAKKPTIKPAPPKPTTPNTTSNTKQQQQARRFVLLRDNRINLTAKDYLNIRNTINRTLKEADGESTKLSVVAVKETLKGNLELSTREGCTPEQVLKFSSLLLPPLHQLGLYITCFQPTTDWHKVAVHGVDLSFFPDTKEGMEQLEDEIHLSNPSVKLVTPPRFLTSPEARNGKSHSSIVIAVGDAKTAATVVNKGLFILASHHKAITYRSCRPISTCSKCLGFGHHHSVCRKTAHCRFCAQDHHTSQHQCDFDCPARKLCRHTTPVCFHCKGAHTANDPNCPTRVDRINKYRNITPGEGMEGVEEVEEQL